MLMSYDDILKSTEEFFGARLDEHGATARGVDWNSPEAQRERFEQLVKVCDASTPFSILDYGCAYGALVDYLMEMGFDFTYTGYDISEKMIDKAIEIHSDTDNCFFYSDPQKLKGADYCIACGIFNLMVNSDTERWTRFVIDTLHSMAALARRGFSFNMLTKYSDPEYMRDDLYYAVPCFFFDYCKRHFSRNVALLHDYDLYDFSIIVRL